MIKLWKDELIKKFGLRISEMDSNEIIQSTLFDDKDIEKQLKIDETIDNLKMRFGTNINTRALFTHSGIDGLSMGMGGGE